MLVSAYRVKSTVFSVLGKIVNKTYTEYILSITGRFDRSITIYVIPSVIFFFVWLLKFLKIDYDLYIYTGFGRSRLALE